MTRMMFALACVALAVAPAAAAPVKQVAYAGIHPLPGHVFCEIEGPHVHVHAPEHADVLYVQVDGGYRFIGDPVPYGYKGPKVAYHGHHPIIDDTYCYLDGPHFHHHAPAMPTKFTLHGGAFWYVGTWSKRYHADAPKRAKINVVYEPLIYVRPVITVAPPPAFHQPAIEIVVAPSVVVGVDVHVHHRHCRHKKHKKHKHHHHHHHDDD